MTAFGKAAALRSIKHPYSPAVLHAEMKKRGILKTIS